MITRALSRWWGLIVFELCAAVYIPTIDRVQLNDDAYSASLESWRIAVGHTPWLDHVNLAPMRRFVGSDIGVFLGKNPDGHILAYRSPGAVAASIPAYWLHGGGPDSTSYNPLPGSITAALLTAAAMALLFSAVRRHVGVPVALAATAVLAFATPMWSVSANWIFTHPITVFGIAGMAWAADRDRWWLVGVFGGVGLWGRLHVALIVAMLGLGMAIWRRDWRIAPKVAMPSAALMAVASVWTHWLYGKWFPSGGYTSSASTIVNGNLGMSPTIGHGAVAKLANQMGLWLAPDRGLLLWSPVLLALLPALFRSWRTLPDWSRMLLIGGVCYTLVQGQLDAFTGGDGIWGYRLMLEALACAFPAFVFSVPALGRVGRAAVPWLCGVMLAAIATGALDPRRVTHGIIQGRWLPQKDAWTNNAYINLLAHGDHRAWAFLAVGLLIGLAAPPLWRRLSLL